MDSFAASHLLDTGVTILLPSCGLNLPKLKLSAGAIFCRSVSAKHRGGCFLVWADAKMKKPDLFMALLYFPEKKKKEMFVPSLLLCQLKKLLFVSWQKRGRKERMMGERERERKKKELSRSRVGR